MRRVHAVAVPQESRIRTALPRIDYADAYQVALPDTLPVDLDNLHRYVLAATPAWARQLMRLRDALVRLAGLKTVGAEGPGRGGHPLRPGGSQGLFQIFERTDDEVITGGDDRHLDFRVSILCPQGRTPHTLTVTTAVQFHNRFGRLYFALIGPFHRLIVPAMLRRVQHNARGLKR